MAGLSRFLLCAYIVLAISSQAYAATLTVNLSNKTTGEPVTVPAGKTIAVTCSDVASGGSEWNGEITIAEGASSGSTSSVPQGLVVKCELSSLSHPWMPAELGLYDVAGPYIVSMPSAGESATVAVQLKPTDGSMTLNLVNKDTGAPIVVPGTSGEKVSCYSSRYSFEAPFATDSSSVTLSVFKSEIYNCSVRNLSGYFIDASFKFVVPSTGSVTSTMPLKPLTQTLTLSLKDVAGNPVMPPDGESTSFECSSSSGSEYYFFSAYRTFDGSEDSVTIQAVDDRTYKCSGEVIGQYKPLPITVTVPAGQSVSVPMTVLQPSVTASFNFERSGAPFELPAGGGTLRCEYSDEQISLERIRNVSQGATSTTIELYAGYQYKCQLTNVLGYYHEQPIAVSAATGSSPTQVIDITQMQATIQVNLVNLDGSAFQAPQNWSAGCTVVEEGSETGLFYGSIASGQSSMQRQVVGGKNIRCEAESPGAGYVVQPVRKDVPASGTTVFDLVVYPTNASVTVRLVDINGVLLTGLLNCSASARPADGGYSANLQATVIAGQATIAIPSGIPITTTAYCDGDGVTGGAMSSDGGIYLQPLSDLSRTVTVAAGGTASVDQVFSLPDATLRVTVQDDTGVPLPGVQIYVASEPTSTGGVYYAGGDTNGDGILPVPVVSQLKWFVHAYSVNGEGGSYTHMGSSEVTVSPAAGQVTDVSFAVKRVSHRLTINITTSDVPSGKGYCMAYNSDGVVEYTPEQPALSEVRQLPLSSGSWKLVCIGWGAPAGSTQDINLLSDIIDIQTPTDSDQFTVTVPVKKASDEVSALASFVKGQGGAVEAPGVQFRVPGDALPIDSASLRVSNAFSDASPKPDRDLGLPFRTCRVDLLDKGGSSIGQFAASDLTLFADAEPGQSLIVKELMGNIWRDVGSTTVSATAMAATDGVTASNSTGAPVTATVKRSGVYGVFVTGTPSGKNPATIGKVGGLRVKFTKGVAKMLWNPVTDATAYNVRVHQTVKTKKGRQQRLVRSRQVTATKLDIKGLKRGQYTFTVWAVNSSAQGEASSTKARN